MGPQGSLGHVLETQRERRRGPDLGSSCGSLRANGWSAEGQGSEGRVRAGGWHQSCGPSASDSGWDGDGRRGHECGFAATPSLIQKMLFLPVKRGAEASAQWWMQPWVGLVHPHPYGCSIHTGRALKHWASGTVAAEPLHMPTSYAGPQRAGVHGATQTSTITPCHRHNVHGP